MNYLSYIAISSPLFPYLCCALVRYSIRKCITYFLHFNCSVMLSIIFQHLNIDIVRFMKVYNDGDFNRNDATNDISSKAPMGDLRSLIEKQELYIAQLEKETKFCREQLAKVLSQVQVGDKSPRLVVFASVQQQHFAFFFSKCMCLSLNTSKSWSNSVKIDKELYSHIHTVKKCL